MPTIITETPIYVWPLLAYIIFVGMKARKTGIVPLKVLLMMPVIFPIWSCYALFSPLWYQLFNLKCLDLYDGFRCLVRICDDQQACDPF